jgi:hypothetical protein
MPTLKWGMSGDAVAALQTRLGELGYYLGSVDGYFGPLTRSAVMAFQRAKALVEDRIVGPATWSALGIGSPEQGPSSGTGSDRALSLHIGVNRVDPARYGGWNGALNGCENDARTMMAIATAEGFTTKTLFTQQATTTNVVAEIRAAAARLTSGGVFLLTYAGHGGQVPNTSADAEEDQQDETWVLYDRQFLDDEIEQALTAFAAGVNIVMLSDSCHSGTVCRKMDDPTQRDFVELKRSYYVDLAVPRPGPDDPAIFGFPRPAAAALAVRSRVARGPAVPVPDGATTISATTVVQRYPGQRGVDVLEHPVGMMAVMTRELPFETNLVVNERQADDLRAAKDAARSRAVVQANGILISGCLDSQLSQEVGGNGVFTTTLKRTWADNTFTGSFVAFHNAIKSQMGPTQVPALTRFGADPNSLAARTPFNL